MLVTKATSIDNAPVVIVTNGKEEVILDTHLTIKRNQDVTGLFDKTNEYQATLSEDTQSKIFELLKVVNDLDAINMNNNYYYHHVKGIITEVINLYDYDRFIKWFKDTGSKGIVIPDKMVDVFVFDPDTGETVDKTYVIPEYIELTGMIMFFRMMFPFYNNYQVHMTTKSTHVYYSILKLFLGTRIDRGSCLEEIVPSMEELIAYEEKCLNVIGLDTTTNSVIVYNGEDYIDQSTGECLGKYICALDKLLDYSRVNYENINGTRNRQKVIMGTGLPEEEAIVFLVAGIIFKKLVMMDFFNDSANPISHIFNGIKYTSEFRSGATNDLRTKPELVSGGEEEYSFYENNRKTVNLALGTVVELQHALNNDENIIRTLGFEGKFNYEMYKNELTNIGIFMERQIEPTRIYMLGWLLKSIINPRALFYIDRRRLIELLMLAKVCLYEAGHDYIGTFLCCHKETDSGYVNKSVTIRSSLDKNLLKELNEMFNFSINDKGLTYEKTIVDFSKDMCNVPWKVIGESNPKYVNDEGFLITVSNTHEVIVDYIWFVLSLGK